LKPIGFQEERIEIEPQVSVITGFEFEMSVVSGHQIE
jgi:hypothetical protein